MEKIAYIAGFPKSGTTWLRMLFSAYLNRKLDINNLLCTRGDTYRYAYQMVSPKPLDELDLWEWAALAPAAALHLPSCVTERPLLIKTHHTLSEAFGHQVVPLGLFDKAIYIVRDPRDVAISLSKHIGTDIDTAIERMIDPGGALFKAPEPPQFVSSWANNVVSWVKNKEIAVAVVRYEELFDSPEETFGALMLFLGEKETVEMRDNVKNAVSLAALENVRKQEDAKGFVEASRKAERFFGAGGSKWRDVLTDTQVAQIEEACGQTMVGLGYPLESKPQLVVAR